MQFGISHRKVMTFSKVGRRQKARGTEDGAGEEGRGGGGGRWGRRPQRHVHTRGDQKAHAPLFQSCHRSVFPILYGFKCVNFFFQRNLFRIDFVARSGFEQDSR